MTTVEWLLAKAWAVLDNPATYGAAGAAGATLLNHGRARWNDRKNSSLATRKQSAEEVDAAFKRLSEVVDVMQEQIASTKTELGSTKEELSTLRDELKRERIRAEEADEALRRARRELRQATHDLNNANATNVALRSRLQHLTALLQKLTNADPALATATVDATLQATIQLTPVMAALPAPEEDEPFEDRPPVS